MPVSIVPSETRHTVYHVLDDLGERYGLVWPEIGDMRPTKHHHPVDHRGTIRAASARDCIQRR